VREYTLVSNVLLSDIVSGLLFLPVGLEVCGGLPGRTLHQATRMGQSITLDASTTALA
jgi:hypothetical protein